MGRRTRTAGRLPVRSVHRKRMFNVRAVHCSSRTSDVSVARSTGGQKNFTLKTMLTTRCATTRRNCLNVDSLFPFLGSWRRRGDGACSVSGIFRYRSFMSSVPSLNRGLIKASHDSFRLQRLRRPGSSLIILRRVWGPSNP